jgi:hypothetical protein
MWCKPESVPASKTRLDDLLLNLGPIDLWPSLGLDSMTPAPRGPGLEGRESREAPISGKRNKISFTSLVVVHRRKACGVSKGIELEGPVGRPCGQATPAGGPPLKRL